MHVGHRDGFETDSSEVETVLNVVGDVIRDDAEVASDDHCPPLELAEVLIEKE